MEQQPERIPNIMHYVFGLEEQTEPFAFVYYLSILSNIKINKPRIIYFHYQYMPYGEWWDKIKDHLTLNYVSVSECAWKNKPIYKTAHKADKIRMEMLYTYGGIYMDIDTITYRPYHLHLEHDWVMGIQEIQEKQNEKPIYGNAILIDLQSHRSSCLCCIPRYSYLSYLIVLFAHVSMS
jgi:mannosyltransferase OCH1-like enzyme